MIAVDRDGVEGVCGGCEVLSIGLLMGPRSDCGRSCEQVIGFQRNPDVATLGAEGVLPRG